jgi:hypothetical protein
MRRDIPHNTPEQIDGYLSDALALVETQEVPEDLRVMFFAKAVELLAAKQIVVEQYAPILGQPRAGS